MNNIIETENTGLICDNPSCDWTDKTILPENFPLWINKPCPKCGDNLLTLEDFDNYREVLYKVELLNSLTPEQMAELTALVDIEEVKKSDLFKDAKGLEHLKDNNHVAGSFSTHKEIKVKEIKAIDPS